jgi:sarcosine oxidase subunit alpha
MHTHVDVLVAGGGPAGLAAAVAAARSGARVLIADEQNELGGGFLSLPDGARAEREWVERAISELRSHAQTRVLARTTVFAYHDHNYLCLVERRRQPAEGAVRQRLWNVRAKQVILATGAHERPIVFPGNDRPGVMLAFAVRTYLNRYGVTAGRNVVVFTNNDSAYAAAVDLYHRGIRVRVVDARPASPAGAARQAQQAGIEVRFASAIVQVGGRRRVRAVRVAALSDDGRVQPGGEWLEADAVAMSGGWSPAVHLFSHSQGKLAWNEALACLVPETSRQAERSVGACRGEFSVREAMAQAARAGADAARACGFEPGAPVELPDLPSRPFGSIRPLWQVDGAAAAGKAFVDFQNDVTSADVALAVREGFESVEHLKRYTTAGMATDQGKTSNVNALAILSGITGRAIAQTGTTTFRPPYTPVTFGALAGRDLGDRLEPIRATPMHDWHIARGAVFENVGQWKRPRYFPRNGENLHRAVARECKAVRGALGVLDASTLGKIEVAGADAAAFLDRVYVNDVANLRVSRCRYGVMCGEDGMVLDDGVITRLAQDRFFLTTTTGGAARVLDWMEDLLQTEWPELRVYLTSATEQWSVIALAGPKSRELLRRLAPGMALERESFGFMSMQAGTVAGVPARVFRISFTGELSYEIHVPADCGLGVWETTIRAGAEFDTTPYGTETMHVLRAEKGFIIVGQETDGTVTPLDLGMDWMVSKTKDFIGRRSLARADTRRPDRKQLVGLLPEQGDDVLPEGAQLVAGDLPKPRPRHGSTIHALGHVTSSYWSANLGRPFALALVKSGRTRIGETVWVPLEERVLRARIVEPVFWDREGRAQHA